MPHTVTYNSDTHTVETIVEGDVTLSILREIFNDQARMTRLHSCSKMLNDYRAATLRLSTMDIYDLPQIIADTAAAHGSDARLMQRALVITRDAEDYYFYETVVDNRSQTEKVFFDMDQAKEWLANS